MNEDEKKGIQYGDNTVYTTDKFISETTNGLDFPNKSVNAGRTNFRVSKAPTPITDSSVEKNFEMPNETLKKENDERERQIAASESENKTMHKNFLQRFIDKLRGKKKGI